MWRLENIAFGEGAVCASGERSEHTRLLSGNPAGC